MPGIRAQFVGLLRMHDGVDAQNNGEQDLVFHSLIFFIICQFAYINTIPNIRFVGRICLSVIESRIICIVYLFHSF